MIRAALLALTLVATPLGAQTRPLQHEVEAVLAEAPQGTRFGLLVVDEAGREVIAIHPDQRFIPGSNTKLFTTAAALALFASSPDPAGLEGATTVALAPRRYGAPDVLLRGGGGVSLSSAPECVSRCLAELARAVAARTRKVHDVIVDPGPFGEPRWSPGMSWNNIGTYSGTALSAVMVDDNAAAILVAPTVPGEPPRVELPAYFVLDNRAQTVAQGPTELTLEREVNARRIVLRGMIATGAAPWRERLGIDNPNHHAAWALDRALREAGVRIGGAVRTAATAAAPPLARIAAVPIDEEVGRINKDSQNIHAEALLRRLGVVAGETAPGTREAGLSAMARALAPAALPATGVELHDGSGMSSYNRLSPRATVALLRWSATQPWGKRFRASLPVAGQDGTLRNRFRASPLAGRLFAKTGTLNATHALSGYLIAASGKELTFSFLANDVPGDARVTPQMDAALLAIAAGS